MGSGVKNNRHNPYGRPAGSRNQIAADFRAAYQEAKDRGYPHPYLLMMEIVCNPNEDPQRRDMFLKECASYVCHKPRNFRPTDSPVPQLNTIEDAEKYLAHLAHELGNELEPLELATVIRHWIESKRAGQELDIKIINNGAAIGEQRIVITGGLTDLPGTDIIMPQINGHDTIDSVAVEPPPQPIDSVAVEPPASGATDSVGPSPPPVVGPEPATVPVMSELPRRADTIYHGLRPEYLAERVLRYPGTPGLYIWRGTLYVDPG